MKQIVMFLFLCFPLAGTMTLPANAAEAQPGLKQGQNAAVARRQDPYRQQMSALMDELRAAKTPEQRKEIQGRMAQARQAYRVAHPVKELTPAEKAARQEQLEAGLKKDPYRWQVYQLQQSMLKAKTQQERQTYQEQIKNLQVRHAAEEEAKLTPEQRAAVQARKEKNAQMQAELKPLNEQLRAAKTTAERKEVQERMQAVLKKYTSK